MLQALSWTNWQTVCTDHVSFFMQPFPSFWRAASTSGCKHLLPLSSLIYSLATKGLNVRLSPPATGLLPRLPQRRTAAATKKNVPWAPWVRHQTTQVAPTTAPSPAARPPTSQREPPPPLLCHQHGSVSTHTGVADIHVPQMFTHDNFYCCN